MSQNNKQPTKKRAEIRAPRIICIYTEEGFLETQTFVRAIEHHAFNRMEYVTVDFSNTERITAAAALYLSASITYCQNCAPEKITFKDQVINFKLPSKVRRKTLFMDTGLWDIIRPGGMSKLERVWSDKTNPFKTGNKPDEQYGDLLKWLAGRNIPPRKKLSSAIQEAYLNIKQHAYPITGTDEFLSGRWWQYAYIKETTNQLVFLLYDRGVGIPYHVKGLHNLFKNDEQKIEVAMTEGWTSTGESGRGRGSKNIQNPVSVSAINDTLLIMSGKGHYVYKQSEQIEIRSLPIEFTGTLIEWALSLSN